MLTLPQLRLADLQDGVITLQHRQLMVLITNLARV